MPLLNDDDRSRLREIHPAPCAQCGQSLKNTYCRSHDEFFERGHAKRCTFYGPVSTNGSYKCESMHLDCRIDTGEELIPPVYGNFETLFPDIVQWLLAEFNVAVENWRNCSTPEVKALFYARLTVIAQLADKLRVAVPIPDEIATGFDTNEKA